MVDLNKLMSLYVEKDEALVLHYTGTHILVGLSGEDRPRYRVQSPSCGVMEQSGSAEVALRDAIHRGVMVAASERKCVLCLVGLLGRKISFGCLHSCFPLLPQSIMPSRRSVALCSYGCCWRSSNALQW